MTQFKHVFSRVLRLHPKFHRPPCDHLSIKPSANSEVTGPNSAREQTASPTVREVQSSTDTLVDEYAEFGVSENGTTVRCCRRKCGTSVLHDAVNSSLEADTDSGGSSIDESLEGIDIAEANIHHVHIDTEGSSIGVEDIDIVGESQELESEDGAEDNNLKAVVGNSEPSIDKNLGEVNIVHARDVDSPIEYEDEDEDAPEVFSYDVVAKTHHEKITLRIYAAVTDDDREIAALRDQDGNKFTHTIRVAFNSLSGLRNIVPSDWTSHESVSKDGTKDLRLTCPNLASRRTSDITALTESQLLASRDYLMEALPERHAVWKENGKKIQMKSGCRESESVVLIVGPPDRCVDVAAVIVCYLAFLTEHDAETLLCSLRRMLPMKSHWRGEFLGRGALDVATKVSKREFQCQW